MRIILGIDPGLTGGLAILDELARSPIGVWDIPTMGTGAQRMVHGAEVRRLVLEHDVTEAALEAVWSRPAEAASLGFKFGRATGQMFGILQGMGIPYRTVVPVVWKRHHGLLKADKDASRLKALEIFPGLETKHLWLKKHHNRAEALLIASWGLSRRSLSGE